MADPLWCHRPRRCRCHRHSITKYSYPFADERNGFSSPWSECLWRLGQEPLTMQSCTHSRPSSQPTTSAVMSVTAVPVLIDSQGLRADVKATRRSLRSVMTGPTARVAHVSVGKNIIINPAKIAQLDLKNFSTNRYTGSSMTSTKRVSVRRTAPWFPRWPHHRPRAESPSKRVGCGRGDSCIPAFMKKDG
jgi:hypothetical protein